MWGSSPRWEKGEMYLGAVKSLGLDTRSLGGHEPGCSHCQPAGSRLQFKSSRVRRTSSLAWSLNLVCPLPPWLTLNKLFCFSGSPACIFEMEQTRGTCPAHLPHP